MTKVDSLFDSLGGRLDKLELEIIHLGNEIDKVKRRLDVDTSIIDRDDSDYRNLRNEIEMIKRRLGIVSIY